MAGSQSGRGLDRGVRHAPAARLRRNRPSAAPARGCRERIVGCERCGVAAVRAGAVRRDQVDGEQLESAVIALPSSRRLAGSRVVSTERGRPDQSCGPSAGAPKRSVLICFDGWPKPIMMLGGFKSPLDVARPGLASAGLGEAGVQTVVQLLGSIGVRSSMLSWGRSVLNQNTHSMVAASTWPRSRHGPSGLISSVCSRRSRTRPRR